MKIVTIWSTYGPYHLSRVRALERAFADATIVCFSHCRSDAENYPFFNETPRVHEILVDRDAGDLTFFKSFASALRRLFFHSPALVLACGYERPETLAAAIYSSARGKPLFLMLDNQYDDRRRNGFVECVKSVYLKRFFSGFVYGGDPRQRYLERLGVTPSLVVDSYNCVDNIRIEQTADRIRRAGTRTIPAARYFLCVARLVEKKNIPGLLLGYLAYKQSLPPSQQPYSLAICGDGPLRAEIESLIEARGLGEHVLMLGAEHDHERVINYLAFAEALVLASSHNEQWGLVVNEAMAAGLPVVVSQQCGCASTLVMDGVNGFRFDADSPQTLGKHLRWLHDNRDRAQAMGEASRRLIAAVTPDRFAADVRSLYEAGDTVKSK